MPSAPVRDEVSASPEASGGVVIVVIAVIGWQIRCHVPRWKRPTVDAKSARIALEPPWRVARVDPKGLLDRRHLSRPSGDLTNQFAVVNLDREGRFAVHVTVDGPAGSAAIESAVDATSDLRPPAFLLAVYARPCLLIGYLWLRVLRRRSVA
jgi:hypothetical protein